MIVARRRFRGRVYLFVRLLEVFHEHGDDHVDQHELRHQHKYDEEHGSDAGGHATVFHAVRRVVAVLAQRVLHDAVPVVAGGHSEQRQERHAEVAEMSVFAQALAHVLLAALCGRNTRARVNVREYTRGPCKIGTICVS